MSLLDSLLEAEGIESPLITFVYRYDKKSHELFKLAFAMTFRQNGDYIDVFRGFERGRWHVTEFRTMLWDFLSSECELNREEKKRWKNTQKLLKKK